jgi:DNA-binding CsgD family transcriptional regulator
MPSYVRGRGGRKLSDAEIIRLYVSGRDADAIGFDAGCSSTTVLNLVRAAGETVRPSGGRRRSVLAISRDQIVQMYRDGQSGPQIAAVAGCTPSTVYHTLRAAGVPLRDSASAGRLAERLRAKRNPAGD